MKSGVESLRTVLANNPVDTENQRGHQGQHDVMRTTSPEGVPDMSGPGSGQSRGSNRSSSTSSSNTSTTATTNTTTSTRGRSGSGSWSSFLPPSLTNKRHSGNIMTSSTTAATTTTTSGKPPGSSKTTSVHRQGSIAESVTESIKSLGNGLGLGQLAGGLGLTGHMAGVSGGGTGPYLSGRDGGQASRSRVWAWNGQDESTTTAVGGSGVEGAGMESDADSIRRAAKAGRPTMAGARKLTATEIGGLKTGPKTEDASKETAVLLAKLRAQQDVALERARRMPEVEQMAQRYQDSWTEIHNHTSRNSERADDADEIMQKALELCLRHATTSEQLVEEAKDIKQLDQSLGEIMSMTEKIQQKLVGLESAIEKMEEDAEVMTLADWKKSQVTELDKYMESKRKELWDKAELLSTRSEQFQKEEAARKLRLYQNQFETDMAQFRRTQEEKEQDLWKLAEADADSGDGIAKELSAGRQESPTSASGPVPMATTLAATAAAATTAALRRLQLGIGSSGKPSASTVSLVNPSTSSTLLAYRDDYEVEEQREKEDLDLFLGPATESDSKEYGDMEEDEEESESEVGESPSDEEETSEEEDEESSDEDDDDLDPIEKARRARATAAAAAAASAQPETKKSSGSTISAFSALAKYSSTTSLINP
ncbi:MAG: hypothetical protein J3R72DRAFT_106041 [Linnemannia gamsii]|nr:MAG: hypothetical protein J3R72DRAFT_106041 [Linnemannia gamsii]